MTDRDGDYSFWQELGGQRLQPTANPGRLLVQHWRCPHCTAVIYSWDRTLPCGKHRIVKDWQQYYQSPEFITDAAAAREQAHPSPPPAPAEDVSADFPGGLPLPGEYPRR